MSHNTDEIVAVLEAVEGVVDSLSPKARERLDAGAYFVRVPSWEARKLLAAVDALRADT